MKTRLTKEGLYYIGIMLCIFIAGIMRGVNLLYIISGMMLGPVIFNRMTARRIIRGVTLRRILPEEIHAGETFPLEIVLETASKYRFGGISVENPCGDAEITLEKIQENSPVPKTFCRVIKYSAVFPHRGSYTLTAVRLWTDYPFGLSSCRKDTPAETILVYPKLLELPPDWRRQTAENAGVEDSPRGIFTHPHGEIFGLRDWRFGDSLRMIHWRASAKHRRPLVRQWEQTTLVHIQIFAVFGPADDASFEKAVSLTASVVHELCCREWAFSAGENGRAAGATLTVKIFGRETRILEGGASYPFYREVLAQLATVEMRETPFPDDFSPAEEAAKSPPGTETIFIRDLVKE